MSKSKPVKLSAEEEFELTKRAAVEMVVAAGRVCDSHKLSSEDTARVLVGAAVLVRESTIAGVDRLKNSEARNN